MLPETRIHDKAIKAWRITSGLFGLLIFIIPAFLFFLVKVENINILIPSIASVGALIIYFSLVILYPKIRWNRWRYDVNEKGVDVYRGIIIRTRTIIPVNRIQHVDTKQGPIYRYFGLSSISISTAATTHEIPALDDQTAIELRALISELVRKVKEDV